MVHQHFMLVPVFTVAENILLGEETMANPVFLDRTEAHRRIIELGRRFGFEIDPEARVETLSVGWQQRVEILKALYREARVLVLDEPTAVLTPQETQEIFAVLRRLRDEGHSIIFISHKLGEVLEIADRITVLRRGKRIDTVPKEGSTEESLARLMVGRDVLLQVEKKAPSTGDPALEVDDLRVLDDRELEAVRGLSLLVRAGEIVALAGVDGNGQHELVEAISGLRNTASGSIRIDGEEVAGSGVRATSDAGVAHIPEDRHLRGLVLDFTLAENLALREYRKPPFSRRGVLNKARIDSRARDLLAEYDVRAGRPGALASSLSGGNQQKVAVAREIASNPSLLIAHQPTRGLDVGAIEFVHRRLIAERDAGRGILLVSLEFEEVRALADRILAIYEGEIVGEFPPDVSEEELGFAMTGGGADRAE
jgi:simple sugar transport system ATP-binding protein